MSIRPPRGRARVAGLLLLPSALAATAALAAPASAAPAYRLVRSEIALSVNRGLPDAWSSVRARRGATIAVRHAGRRGRVLRLADRSRSAGYVAVTTPLGPKTVVTVSARANLIRQRLRRGKSRALVAVAGQDGTNHQAGVFRGRSGPLRWAVWTKGPGGRIADLRVGGRARLRAFHDLRLASRWGDARSRATFDVDGRRVAATPRRHRATAGARVIVGLGRASKRTEVGVMLLRSVRVTAAAPAAVATPAPAAPPSADEPLPGREIFRGDFETGGLDQWSGLQRVSGDRITTVPAPARQGRFAARFEVREGDNPIGYGDRAELQASSGESEGEERWYAWSTMFASDFPRSSAWQVVSQWHANADGSPPLGFYVENDELVLQANRTDGSGSPLDIRRIWRGPLRRGAWTDIRMHVKWSGSDGVGFVELWIDGVRQSFDDGTQRRAIRTLYPGVGAYFKQGLYRQSGISQTGIVYHDGLRISSVD